ncbi:MAG: YchJ family metal-binding protein [Cyanobacteria bacterium P01_C01_bin.69]
MGTKVNQKCWCGSRRAFSSCCEPYLTGDAIAPTAEALMRSRYSAFCTKSVDYLLATHHPSWRKSTASNNTDERILLSRSVNTTQWINLLIIKKQGGQKKDKTGRVEFVAAYRPKSALPVDMTVQSPDGITQLHENSRFVREQGRWFYVDGDILPPYQPKRSQPCWCGSGKPYKHCHFST